MNSKFNLAIKAKFFSFSVVSLTFVYFINIILTNFIDWPGSRTFINILISQSEKQFEIKQFILSAIQFSLYLITLTLVFRYIRSRNAKSLKEESQNLSNLSAYITRSAFWTVFFVGIADLLISFMVSEKAILDALPSTLGQIFFQPKTRILYIHLPLTIIGFIYGIKNKSIGFIWLALLVVFAEALIVISRFVFSYEQAYMGDLVRYWYAALFLFGSAYT